MITTAADARWPGSSAARRAKLTVVAVLETNPPRTPLNNVPAFSPKNW